MNSSDGPAAPAPLDTNGPWVAQPANSTLPWRVWAKGRKVLSDLSREEALAVRDALNAVARGEAGLPPAAPAPLDTSAELAFQLWMRYANHDGIGPEESYRARWPVINVEYWRKQANEILGVLGAARGGAGSGTSLAEQLLAHVLVKGAEGDPYWRGRCRCGWSIGQQASPEAVFRAWAMHTEGAVQAERPREPSLPDTFIERAVRTALHGGMADVPLNDMEASYIRSQYEKRNARQE